MLSVCWIDAFRRIFNYKRSESVRILQVSFGTLDFRHLYDLHRWRFLRTIGCKSTYWVDLVEITDLQYHICVDALLCVFTYLFPLSAAHVANTDI